MSAPLRTWGGKCMVRKRPNGPWAPQVWRAGRNFCSYLWGYTEVTAVWLGSFPEEWPGGGTMTLQTATGPDAQAKD